MPLRMPENEKYDIYLFRRTSNVLSEQWKGAIACPAENVMKLHLFILSATYPNVLI
jgi:hypothetical protein